MRFLTLLETYILLASTFLYIIGIALSQIIGETTALLLLLAATFLLLLWSLRHRQKMSLPLLLVFFLLTGMYNGHQSLIPPTEADHISALVSGQRTERVVLGTVQRIFSYDGESVRFDVAALSQKSKHGQFHRTRGLIRYTLKDQLSKDIQPGTVVLVRGTLKRAHRFATPGSFDYPGYLAAKGIYITGYIDSSLYITAVVSTTSLLHKFRHLPELTRYRIARFVETRLEPRQAAIYQALLTGDKSAVPPDIMEDFKSAGLLHILAISGMHMSLLGVFLFAIIFWLLRRSEYLILRLNTKKCAAVLCIMPLLFYALIAGAQTPVLRSFIMSLIVILALCGGMRHNFPTLVAGTALLLLTLSPQQLFTPSFQLSFVAIIAITAALPFLRRLTELVNDHFSVKAAATTSTWIATGMVVSLAATLGTAPLLIHHFNRISLVGVAANLIVEPLICLWTLSLGFVAVPLMALIPSVAELLLHVGGIGITLALRVSSFFASLPNASLHLPSVSLFLISIYYIGFCSLFWWKNMTVRHRLIPVVMSLTALFFMVLPPAELTKRFRLESEISYLDVGHGSCSLIQMPGGRRALIDGGALSSPGFDIGERIIAPFLYAKGISRIDDIVITHPDSDHYNGIATIIRRFNVKTLWLSLEVHEVNNWDELIETARKNDVEIKIPAASAVVFDHGRGSLEIIANTAPLKSGSSNDKGL
ncbi:MAG TPA: ComEC/Rec2 family competence protein, partial [Desulfopila sp.]|nr:ComEC/Rec2 family competence protein [Desulfopila sp.]